MNVKLEGNHKFPSAIPMCFLMKPQNSVEKSYVSNLFLHRFR